MYEKLLEQLDKEVLHRFHNKGESTMLSGFNVSELGEIYDWIEAQDNQSEYIIIKKSKAPEWLRKLSIGNKIDAMKSVRSSLQAHAVDEYGKHYEPALMHTKHFVEDIQSSIVSK